MKIGVISDSHDNMPMIHKAVAYLNEQKVEHVLHAGDFSSPFTFRALKNLTCEFTGVFGNNDGEKVLLKKLSNGRIFTQPHILELRGKKIVVMHEQHVVDALADSGHFDLVIYGHTHETDIRKKGKTLIVNPGELSGWLNNRSTLAIVNLMEMTARIIEL